MLHLWARCIKWEVCIEKFVHFLLFSNKHYVIYILSPKKLSTCRILLYACQVDTVRIREADSLELTIGMLGIRRLMCYMLVMEYMNNFIRHICNNKKEGRPTLSFLIGNTCSLSITPYSIMAYGLASMLGGIQQQQIASLHKSFFVEFKTPSKRCY